MIEVLPAERLKIHEYNNAYVLRYEQYIVAFDENGHFIENTSKRMFGLMEYKREDDIDPSQFDNELEEYDELLYLGFMRGHWGHFLVDSSVRMWAIAGGHCNYKILANIEGMNDFYSWWFDKFNINIKKDIIDPHGPIRVKKLMVPDVAYLPGQYIFKKYITPFDYIKSQVSIDEGGFEKIYLSRFHGARGHKQLGEKDIQKMFSSNGFKIIYPEELPAEEQIKLYASCKVMVTTTGTIAHNIVFSNPGTELIILDRYPGENIHQASLSMIREAREVHVKAYARCSTHENNLLVISNEVKKICIEHGWRCKREPIVKLMLKYVFFYFPKAYKLYWLLEKLGSNEDDNRN